MFDLLKRQKKGQSSGINAIGNLILIGVVVAIVMWGVLSYWNPWSSDSQPCPGQCKSNCAIFTEMHYTQGKCEPENGEERYCCVGLQDIRESGNNNVQQNQGPTGNIQTNASNSSND